MKTKLVNPRFETNFVDNLLIYRGIKKEELPIFKHPTIECLSEPENLDNITLAATRILSALEKGEKIGLLRDCDVDGWTSSGLTYLFLKEINPNIEIYTTFHSAKQHGLSDTWERFIEEKCDLVIEMDAGINDKEFHDLLGEAGITTIVGDHHEYEGGGYSDHAIYVDNQTSPNYANKSLAGCGIAWQICRMVDKLNGSNYAFKYIDLVALGCAADVMSPLTLENRFIFDYGFSHLENPVFKAIVEKQSFSMKGKVNYTSVAFYVAPLINACMRTGTLEEKEMMYSMLLDPTQQVVSEKRGAKGEIVSIVEECLRILTNVKARQQKLIDSYTSIFRDRIESEGLDENNIILVHLRDEDDFESELNGLLAMRFSEMYHKPCLFIRDGLDGATKGSARNPNGSPVDDLKELINSSPYTTFTAGHANAHGLGIKTQCLDRFIEWFNNETAAFDFTENTYQVNYEAGAYDSSLSSVCRDIANNEEYWGGNNPTPIISVKNIIVKPSDFKIMGKNLDTLKLEFAGMSYIKFFAKPLIEELNRIDDSQELVINIIGRANLNEWMGRTSVQIMIDDLDWKFNDLLEF